MNHTEQQAAAVNTDLDGPEKYENAAKRIDAVTLRLLHAAMGLCTETGEIMDVLKKWIIYGKPMDRVNLYEEGGDISWYLRILADELKELAAGRCSFEDMLDRNIAKLKARYPEKFSEERALNRDLAAERKVLEDDSIPNYPNMGSMGGGSGMEMRAQDAWEKKYGPPPGEPGSKVERDLSTGKLRWKRK